MILMTFRMELISLLKELILLSIFAMCLKFPPPILFREMYKYDIEQILNFQ